mmetsp:Transcript_45512/g.131841  ORF Transcript_45512/g.131841 Transcript_45512/m.131841 type:complete len:515 (+) Transcript_45512:70-1614(+)
MASLWNMLREEVLGTVDDFRQKGALGALRDAALDTKDMAVGAGGWLVDGVKGIIDTNEVDGNASQAYIIGPDVPKRGHSCMLSLPNGTLVEATVIDVDGVSEPPRARVTAPGLDEPLLVPILDPAAPAQSKEEDANAEGENTVGNAGMGLLEGFKQELHSTVQEFREKGAVGAMRDAALDAVDMVGSTAQTAVNGAKSLAEPCVQDFREKGAVGAVKDAALDAVDLLGNTAKTAVDGAKSIATPLIDLVSDQPDTAQQAGKEGVAAESRSAAASSAADSGEVGNSGTLLDGLRQEWHETVQDIRQKGAVGAVKDAALDAVDLVGTTATTALGAASSTATTALGAATTAFHGARARAGPLLEQVSGNLPDLWADSSATASSAPTTTGGAEGAAAAAPAQTHAPAASAEANTPAEPTSAAQKPAVFAPPARSAAGASSSGPSAPEQTSSAPAGEEADGNGVKVVPMSPRAKESVNESDMPGAKAGGRRSLVSMRRGAFEKPKPEEAAKKEAEELID